MPDMYSKFKLEPPSTYPFDVSRRSTGSALTAGPFWQTAPKGTKKALPQRSAIAALRFPLSGSAAQARRDGPSMAQHGSPGFLPGGPLHKTYARPAEGACRSKAKQSKNAVRFGSKKTNCCHLIDQTTQKPHASRPNGIVAQWGTRQEAGLAL